MASPEFTSQGIIIQTFDEIFEQLVVAYQAIYGFDIDVAQDSPDGQNLGIIAKFILDGQSFGVSLYNSFDPDLAEGVALDKISKISGITRNSPDKSVWALDITVDVDLTLPATYVVKDDLNQTWTISEQTSVTVAGNPNPVVFIADDFGAIVGDAGSTIEQATPEIGVVTIDAPINSTVGVDEETDAQLRGRRARSLQNPSLGTRAGLEARLLNINDITDAKVYENQTSIFDPTLELDSHSLWVVVEGGTDAEIVNLINTNKSGGTGLKGDISIVSPSGDLIRFDRSLDAPLFIRVDATKKDPSSDVDIELIKDRLADKKYVIAENAIASKLYDFGYMAGENFILSSLEISLDDIIYTDERIIAPLQSKFVIDTANITVMELG